MNISVQQTSGDIDEWHDVEVAVDTQLGGALLVTDGAFDLTSDTVPRNLVAMYAGGMWMKLEVLEEEAVDDEVPA